MQYWEERALPKPEQTILGEEEYLGVLREDIGIPTESVNRKTQEYMQEIHQEGQQQDYQEAILLDESDAYQEARDRTPQD
jgi:hypothetical protein